MAVLRLTIGSTYSRNNGNKNNLLILFCFSGTTTDGIKGWFTDFLEEPPNGRNGIGLRGPGDFTSGLVAVPFTIQHFDGVQDTAALVGGMLGFTVHRIPNCDEVSVQPFQGWSLMLDDEKSKDYCKADTT